MNTLFYNFNERVRVIIGHKQDIAGSQSSMFMIKFKLKTDTKTLKQYDFDLITNRITLLRMRITCYRCHDYMAEIAGN